MVVLVKIGFKSLSSLPQEHESANRHKKTKQNEHDQDDHPNWERSTFLARKRGRSRFDRVIIKRISFIFSVNGENIGLTIRGQKDANLVGVSVENKVVVVNEYLAKD